MIIRSVYSQEPTFPATDQHPQAVRYQVGAVWVDAIGGQPTQADIDALYAPAIADAAKVAAVKANARRVALITAIQNSDDAGVISYVNTKVTDLASAKVLLTDLALLVAGVIRS